MIVFRSSARKILAFTLALILLAGCSREAKKARHLKKAEHYFNTGEYDKAKIEYLNALRFDRQNPVAMQQLGAIWLEQGAPLHAFPFLMKARDLAPDNPVARIRLGRAFLAVGHPADARKEALAVLQQSPLNEDAILLLADAARSPDEIQSAEEQIRKLPENKRLCFNLATAALSLQKGDVPSAETALKSALALDPKSAQAHSLMADIHRSRNKTLEAEQEFKIAADLSPLRSTAQLRYAEYKMQTGAGPEAKELLNGLASKVPDFLPVWELLAQIAFSEKNYDDAQHFVETILGRDPNYFNARMLQVQILIAKGENGKAADSMEKLDQTYSTVPVVKYQLARVRLLNNSPSQAALALKQAIALNPDYTEAILLLGEINLRNGESKPVVEGMVNLLKKRPQLEQAQVMLASAYRMQGRPDEASAVFREAIKNSPEKPTPHFLLGLVLREQHRDQDARAEFEKALELAPGHLLILSQIIDLEIAEKNFDEAFKRVREQIEKTPKLAGAQFLEAKIYSAQEDWDHAEIALLKTLELDPSYASAYDLLISEYVLTNKLPKAVEKLEGLLAKNPDDARSLMLSALIYDKLNEPAKAGEAYEKLLTKRPDFTPALNNLAYLYASKLNRLDRSYDLARTARNLQPADPAIADTLGWVLYLKGDYQQALPLLQESAGKLPNLPEIQFHLGMAYYMMNRTEPAKTALQQAVNSPSNFSGKEEAQRKLALLGKGPENPVETSTAELEAILKRTPDDIVARIRLGEAYEREGSFQKAAEVYESAFKLNPKLLSGAEKLAQLYSGPLQNRDRALDYARKARALAPNDPKIAGILGGIAYRNGNFTWAYSLLRESASQPAQDIAVLHDLAWAAYSLGKESEAILNMQLVTESSPSPEVLNDARSFLAMNELLKKSDPSAADETMATSLLKSNPDYVPALMVLGKIQAGRNEKKAAIATYTRALVVFPDFSPAQKQLAVLYVEDPATLAKAYELAMKARTTLSNDVELARLLAEISYKRNNYSYAASLLEENLKQSPPDARSLYYLGMSRLQLKQISGGRDALKQALASGLGDPLAAEAKRTLQELDNPNRKE